MFKGNIESTVLLTFAMTCMAGFAQVSPDGSGGANPPLTEAALCIHNGGEAYIVNPIGFPNGGGGKYFPSFTHWTATSVDGLGLVYPWKIRGWCWAGVQGKNNGPLWYWESLLQNSKDNPYSTTMSWDYPLLYCTGAISHSGPPWPIYGGMIPSVISLPFSNNSWIFPSSMGGWDSYMNIFATLAASWLIPSTMPFYSVKFGLTFPCESAITIPSSESIWEFVWNAQGPYSQYLVLSNDEKDCLFGLGNKGKSYSLLLRWNGTAYWKNYCSGVDSEWAMCLFVCDAVTIPVNVPGSSNPPNPFLPYGFDVGSATITPYISSNSAKLGFMTQDGSGIGGGRVALAAFAFKPPVGPYGKNNFRIPHGFDVLTSFFLGVVPLFTHTPAPGYPACMYGTTIGAHSAFLPFPADPALLCAEIRYSSYAMTPGAPMSASYMVTAF